MVTEYVECIECGLVTLASNTPDPTPMKWDACPGCGGDEFDWTS